MNPKSMITEPVDFALYHAHAIASHQTLGDPRLSSALSNVYEYLYDSADEVAFSAAIATAVAQVSPGCTYEELTSCLHAWAREQLAELA